MKPYKLLLVEDELVIALDLQVRLADLGYEVVGDVCNAAAAVAAAELHRPDLVLMDIQLSDGSDGIEAAKEIRRNHDVPVVFLTAYGDEATLQRSQEAEPYGFLLKPVDDRDLRVTIETALGRHEAEKRTQESESRLRRAIKAGKVGLWEWDLTSNTVYYSPEWKSQIGYGDEEIEHNVEAWRDRLHPEDLDRVLRRLQDSLREPWPEYEAEFRLRHKNGDYRWIMAQASLDRDKLGKPLRLLGSHVDITAQKAHETEIERLSWLYMALSQVNQLITRVTTREQLLEGVCRELVQFGRLKMAWIGLRDAQTLKVLPVARHGDAGDCPGCIDILAEDSPKGLGPTDTAIREGRTVVCNVFSNSEGTKPRRQAGVQPGFGASAAFPIRMGGTVCGALTVYAEESGFFRDKEVLLFEEASTDVSFALDHLAQESQKRLAEHNYQTLFREMLNGFALHEIRCDEAGKPFDYRFLAVNPAFERMTGLKAEKVVGRTVLEVMPDTERYWIDTYGKVAMTGEPVFFEHYSSELRKHFEVAAFRPGQGQFACIISDITQRKLLEDQLRQTQKLESIGQLAGGVAHDFNNILSAIMIQLSFLQNNKNLDGDTQETLTELMTEAKRAANLTRQLLMFSRRSVLDVKVLDLNELVANLLKMLGRLIGEHIGLRFDQQSHLPPVAADPGMLEQVIMNLAVNARDAMPKGGRLTIGVEPVHIDAERVRGNVEVRPGQFVCLTVADTGHGMDEATLNRIFEPFFTTKEQGKGTGLGLATAHGIVAQHKGWIEVESAVGRGSVFKVFLPAISATTDKKQDKPSELLQGSETILVVEDEASVRRMVVQGMRMLGYNILEASNGIEAENLWQDHRQKIDLLFSDMVMPEGVSGLDLALRLRLSKPGLKVILSSGYNTELIDAESKLPDGVCYLAKPYEIDFLSRKLRECLDGK